MNEQLIEGFRVFLYGFGGVFAGLLLLMGTLQITTYLIRWFTSKK